MYEDDTNSAFLNEAKHQCRSSRGGGTSIYIRKDNNNKFIIVNLDGSHIILVLELFEDCVLELENLLLIGDVNNNVSTYLQKLNQ